jgi:hypothetical protein
MKKITFILVFLLGLVGGSYAQCIRTSQYPSSAVVSNNLGLAQNISTCNYTSEFAVLSGLVVGSNYAFTCVGSGVSKYITVTDLSDTVIAFGDSPLTVSAITSADVRVHFSNDAACTGTSTCHITTVQMLLTCPVPTAAAVSAITTTGASFAWTAGGSETAWEVLILPSTSPAPVAADSGIATTSPTYDEIALSSSTSYKFYVRANCGSEFSPWSTGLAFSTACVALTTLPWTENFDALATGTNVFPSCWAYLNTLSTWSIDATNVVAYSGANSLRRSWSTDGWAYTPLATLTAGTSYTFSYYMRTKDATIGYDLTIGVGNGQTEADMTTTLSTTTGYQNPTWTKFTFEFTPSTTGDYSFGVHVVAPVAPNGINFDDFKLDVSPTCTEPTSISASLITSSGATVSWVESVSSPTNGYEYFVSTSNTAPLAIDAATGSVPAGIATVDLTLLSPATVYYVWVRSICSATDKSAWSSSVTFTTSCVAVTTFTENFDAAVAFPTCWARVGTGGNTFVQASTTAPSLPNNLYLYGTSATSQGLVMMPPVSNAGAGTHQLKFKARANFTVGGVIEVGYLTDIADATTFVSVQTFTTTSTTVYDSFVADLGTAPGTNEHLAFRHLGTPANSVLIDDVSWLPIPATPPACTTNIVSVPDAACGNRATTITWDANPDANGYKLTMGTTSGGNDILDNVIITSTNYSYLGNANTTYYFTIVTFNGVGDATGCTENTFTTAATGCYCPSVPTSNDNSGITNIQLGSTDYPVADVTYYDNSATTVDLAQGVNTNLQISFATGYTYDTNVWIDFNDNTTFDTDELVQSVIATVSTNPNTMDASFLMPATATLGQHRMRIGTADFGQVPPDPCFSGSYGVTVDFTVNITVAPSCLTPTALVASVVTSSTATVSWTQSVSSPTNGYEYFVSTSNTAPLATDLATGSVPAGISTVNLTLLSPSTLYYVWARSICSATDKSAWSTPVSFTTACVALTTLPWTENFDALATGTNVFPSCWAYLNTLSTWSIDATNVTAYSGANSLRRSWSTDGWAYTPLATLTAGTSYTFSYYMRTKDTTVGYDLTIGVGNGQTAADMTTTLSTTTGYQNPTWTKFTFEFTPSTTGDYSFGVHVVAPIAPNGINFDDFALELSPTCEAPISLVSSNISITTATVSWTASTSTPANGYEYYVSTTNTAPGANTIATGTVGAGMTMVDLINLSPATTYYVWVRSLCSSTLLSSWSVSTTFTTLVAPTQPVNDDCSGAIVLTPAGDFASAVQTGTLFAATSSNFIPTCQTSVSSDVWYKVVVPTSGNITIETQSAAANSMTNSVIAAFTGACNTFVQVGCNDNNGSSSMSLLSLTAQTPGATLYIGVWNIGNTTTASNSEFKIAAYDASLANDTFNNNSFSYYPNPVKDVLNLSYSKNITNISVYNLLGQQVIVKTVNDNQSQIDMSKLSNGTYMVKVTADNQVKTIKVIKQ